MDVLIQKYFWGIDCGSSEIKVVVCDASGNIIDKRKQPTLFPLLDHVVRALKTDDDKPSPFDSSGSLKEGHIITASGYGRHHIDFASHKLTEIKAHFMGVKKHLGLKKPYTIIDIGGQDSKVITIKENNIHHFEINRKCAAGTGAFIEALAHRLKLKLNNLTTIAEKHDKEMTLNSFCTVFAEQEVIKILMSGEKVENLIHALYKSVVKRVLEMTAITTDTIVFSGGVIAYHTGLVNLFKEQLKDKEFFTVPETQYCGAYGAALYGIEENPCSPNE
ncbi:MAG: hypothetical protein HQM16_09670 [Deltaproteobacteria bacterium]|nr:hypothetical protein [Deltaproteobacteria bacterium]